MLEIILSIILIIIIYVVVLTYTSSPVSISTASTTPSSTILDPFKALGIKPLPLLDHFITKRDEENFQNPGSSTTTSLSSCPITNLDSNGCQTSSCSINGVNNNGMNLMYQFTYYIECTIKLFIPYIDYKMLNKTVYDITNKNISDLGIFEKSCILNVLTTMSNSQYNAAIPNNQLKYSVLYAINIYNFMLKDICNVFYDKNDFDNNMIKIYFIYKNKTITDYKQLGTLPGTVTETGKIGDYGLIWDLTEYIIRATFIPNILDDFNTYCNQLVRSSLIKNLKINNIPTQSDLSVPIPLSLKNIILKSPYNEVEYYMRPAVNNILFSNRFFTQEDNKMSQSDLINRELEIYKNGFKPKKIEDLFG